MTNRIYLHHNATSPASAVHLQNVFSKLQTSAGNPSSPHAVGRCASVALTEARRLVARALGVDVAQLIFVSGASEANNMATVGVLRYLGVSLSHAITSAIEHPAILEPLQFLQKNEGLNLTVINSSEQGFISVQHIIENIKEQTNYISLMAANNEIGSIQPVKLLADFLHYKRWGIKPSVNFLEVMELEKFLTPSVSKENLQKIHFHVDAVQAFGKIKQEEWFSPGIDSCAISGHKLGALQGVGALFLQRGRKLNPLILGGAQEKNRRSGTENLPGIISLGLICEDLLQKEWWEKITEMNNLRLRLYNEVHKLPNIIMNSPRENVIPNTINFSVNSKTKNGEDLLLELDLHGICAISGSACSSGANLPSKVLLAMGKNSTEAKNAIRISLSPNTSQSEIHFVINSLNKLLT